MTQLPQAVEIEEILINGSVTQLPQAVEIGTSVYQRPSARMDVLRTEVV